MFIHTETVHTILHLQGVSNHETIVYYRGDSGSSTLVFTAASLSYGNNTKSHGSLQTAEATTVVPPLHGSTSTNSTRYASIEPSPSFSRPEKQGSTLTMRGQRKGELVQSSDVLIKRVSLTAALGGGYTVSSNEYLNSCKHRVQGFIQGEEEIRNSLAEAEASCTLPKHPLSFVCAASSITILPVLRVHVRDQCHTGSSQTTSAPSG